MPADPAAAKAIPAGPNHATAIYMTARQMARQDAKAAFAWAETCDGDYKPFAIAGVLHGIADGQ